MRPPATHTPARVPRRPAPTHALAARLALAALASLWLGCAAETHRYSPAQAKASLKRLDGAGMVIGEFPISKIIDGDTIAVAGLDSTLRLLAMDAEETFKNAQDARDADADFEQYLKAKRGGSARPTKAATPLGEAAKKFAVEFFKGVRLVRLERDNATEIRDRYDRYLAYVIVTRDGKELNYNVEAVRAGMSPYFTKYGYSRRFHADFVAAEKEARAAGRGTVSSSLLIPREGGRTALRIPSLPAEQPGAADSPRETSSPPPSNASTASPLAPVGPSPLKELPFVAGATLFVGGATVGAVFGLRAISLKNERDLECDAVGCSGAGLAKQEDARSAAVVSTVAFLVAGAGATLATVWLLLPRTKAAPMALRAGCVGATCGATLAGGF